MAFYGGLFFGSLAYCNRDVSHDVKCFETTPEDIQNTFRMFGPDPSKNIANNFFRYMIESKLNIGF